MKKTFTKLLMLLGLFAFFGAGNASSADYSGYYLNIPGDFNGWGDNGVEFPMNNSGLVVNRNLQLANHDYRYIEVKVWNGNKSEYYGFKSNGTKDLNTWLKLDYTGENGNTGRFTLNYSKNSNYYKAVWNHDESKLWVSEDKMYLFGDVNGQGFAANNYVVLNRIGNGKYSGTVNIGAKAGNANFSFAEAYGTSSDDWSSLGLRYGADSDNQSPTLGNNNNLKLNETYNSFQVPAGNYTITIDVTDNKKPQFTIQQNSVIPSYPATVYLMGDYNGMEDSWMPQGNLAATTASDGVYTWTGVKLLANNMFSFAEAQSTDNTWEPVNAANRYGSPYEYDETLKGNKIVTRIYNDAERDLTINKGEVGAWTIDQSGLYNITLDLRSNKVKLTLLQPLTSGTMWRLSNGTQTWDMTQVDNSNIFTCDKMPQNGEIYVEQALANGVFYPYMAKNDVTLNSSNGQVTVDLVCDLYKDNLKSIEGKPGDLVGKRVKYYGVTKIVWNAKTFKLSIEEEPALPEKMYLYGHIQGGSWDRGNYAELMPDPETPGLYTNSYVDISGEWNEWDGTLGHKPWTDCGDECYVAFFEGVNTVPRFEQKGSGVFKYGSLDYENNVEGDRSNFMVEKNQIKDNPLTYSANFDKQVEIQRNNFIVPKGFYSVEFNFNDGTVKFEEVKEVTPAPHTYRWYYGDDNNDYSDGAIRIPDANKEGGYAEHEVGYGDGNKAFVQVGLVNNPKHNAARQAEFYVWVYNPSLKAKNAVKAKITPEKIDLSSASDDVLRGLYLDSGYEYIGKSIDGKNTLDPDYVVPSDGGSNWDDNHIIELKKEGQYIISATLKPNADGINDKVISDVIDSTLLATVRDISTGVTEVEFTEDGEAVYYNLQGVKVQNPEHGIFVKVQNGKATKVVK